MLKTKPPVPKWFQLSPQTKAENIDRSIFRAPDNPRGDYRRGALFADPSLTSMWGAGRPTDINQDKIPENHFNETVPEIFTREKIEDVAEVRRRLVQNGSQFRYGGSENGNPSVQPERVSDGREVGVIYPHHARELPMLPQQHFRTYETNFHGPGHDEIQGERYRDEIPTALNEYDEEFNKNALQYQLHLRNYDTSLSAHGQGLGPLRDQTIYDESKRNVLFDTVKRVWSRLGTPSASMSDKHHMSTKNTRRQEHFSLKHNLTHAIGNGTRAFQGALPPQLPLGSVRSTKLFNVPMGFHTQLRSEKIEGRPQIGTYLPAVLPTRKLDGEAIDLPAARQRSTRMEIATGPNHSNSNYIETNPQTIYELQNPTDTSLGRVDIDPRAPPVKSERVLNPNLHQMETLGAKNPNSNMPAVGFPDRQSQTTRVRESKVNEEVLFQRKKTAGQVIEDKRTTASSAVIHREPMRKSENNGVLQFKPNVRANKEVFMKPEPRKLPTLDTYRSDKMIRG